ncbi:MAG: enoyl-CoA hydratase/isomerase family protein [Microbacteriaceae bacterium]|nr:enoyl-CoA hydratase/isomerase family protein [Microbacteriaceae bacterium]
MGSIQVEQTGAVATVSLSSVGKRNAISASMWRELPIVLDSLASIAELKLVVLRGAGNDFSSGADISELDEILPALGENSTADGIMTAAEDALADFPLPTLAAIDGFCVGGGWQLAAACDIRICSERSTFGVTPSRLGIIYPLSGIRRLVSIVGPAMARHILYSGEIFDSATAANWGMVSEVVPDAKFWERVAEFSETLASRSQFSIRATKKIIDALGAGGTEGESAARATVGEWLGKNSPDRELGIAAFLRKERPDFEWNG